MTLLPESRPCPLCASSARFERRGNDTFYQVTSFEVDLFRCPRCFCLFQDPMPERAEIAGFYPTGYWQETVAKPSLIGRLQARYIRFMLQADLMAWVKRLKLQPGSRFLDVGCSRGDWLALIQAQGFQARGLEADPRAAAFARTTFGLEIEESDGETWLPAQGSEQTISFFHLLEHLREPKLFLAKVYAALEPGGQVLIRVPNARSWQARLLGAAWKGWETPRHLVMFSPAALVASLEAQGFGVSATSTWALRDGPPCLASSLFPSGEPTWQQIKQRPSAWRTLVYLALTWCVTPLELLAALCGQGAMITVIAQKVAPQAPHRG